MTARTVAELRKWATDIVNPPKPRTFKFSEPDKEKIDLARELLRALDVVEAADKYESIDMDNVTDIEGVRLTVALCAAVRAWREHR